MQYSSPFYGIGQRVDRITCLGVLGGTLGVNWRYLGVLGVTWGYLGVPLGKNGWNGWALLEIAQIYWKWLEMA